MTNTLSEHTVFTELSAEQTAELEQIRQQIKAMLPVDVKQKKSEIKEYLRQILHDAKARGDEATHDLAKQTWRDVQEMAAAQELTEGMAAGNALATQVAKGQRDDLLHAIDHEDTMHPQVGALIAGIQEETEYSVVMREQDAARQEAFEIAAANLQKHYGLHEETAARLACDIVKGNAAGYERITDDQRQAIGDAITSILEDWRPS